MEAITYWLINTPGIGALIVFAVGLGVLAAYGLTIRWIQNAPRDPVVVPVNEPPAKNGVDHPNGR